MTVQLERLRAVHATRLLPVLNVRRYLLPMLLAGYAIFVLSLYFRGLMTWYINPTYVLPATAAAVVLLGFSLLTLRRPVRAACEGDECCVAGDCGCAASPKLWAYGVLAVPLLLGFLVPPHSLAAFSAHQRGPQIAGFTMIRGAVPVRRVSLSVDTSTFGLQDWVGALSGDPNPNDFKGKPITLTGMVLHDPSSVPPGYLMVLRYQVTCCIADARPEGLAVRDISNGTVKDNEWVTVRGAMAIVNFGGQKMAVVAPKKITQVKAGNPYMY
ncbi:MAG: TIGR03943 family putative permease subunit [Chloroflexota bacterium]